MTGLAVLGQAMTGPGAAVAARTAMLFGKLPAHGDFVARGLAAAARDSLDDWLAGSLAAARGVFGAAFEPRYDCATAWRFGAVEDGVGVAAALAPSVDGAGRRYPILVMRSGLAPDRVMPMAEACESLLFDALAEGWTADLLAEAVAALAPAGGEAWSGGPCWWSEGGEGFGAARLPGERPANLFTHALSQQETP